MFLVNSNKIGFWWTCLGDINVLDDFNHSGDLDDLCDLDFFVIASHQVKTCFLHQLADGFSQIIASA